MKQGIYFQTGSTLLDLVVGGAPGVMGYPAGKFINIVGDKSAGKSFLCSELVAAAYHRLGPKKFKWVYDDCEAGYSFNSESLYGFEIIPRDKEGNSVAEVSTTVEEAFVNIHNFCESLKDDQVGMYILDSLDGLTSDEQDEQASARVKAVNDGKSYDKGTYGMGKPKYLSREFFPQLCSMIQNRKVLVVIVSQVRDNIEPFSFEKHKRNGGKAMDFYGHTVLWLATLKKIVKKSRPVGVVIKAKTTKSKTPRPFRDCQFSLVFDYGLDNIGSNLDFLYELRTDKGELTPAAKSISWGGQAKKQIIGDVKKFLKGVQFHPRIGKKQKQNAYEYWKECYDKLNLESALLFIDENEEVKTAYEKEFGGEGGKTFSRDALIDFIETKKLEQELIDKVVEKWELIEEEIATQRKKKYATQPRGGEA